MVGKASTRCVVIGVVGLCTWASGGATSNAVRAPADEFFFIANTSRASFRDLIRIHRRSPRFEGLFDRVHDMDDRDTIRKCIQEHEFTPEAEWVMVFKDAVGAQDPQTGRDEEDIKKMPVTFTGMIEGKFLDQLYKHGTANWASASKGNNFLNPSPGGRPFKGYLTIGEWDEKFRNAPKTGTPFDSAWIEVHHRTDPDASSYGLTFSASFGSMRTELFNPKRHKRFNLVSMTKGVLTAFDRETQGRSTASLRGINLGVHGRNGGVVKDPRVLRGQRLRTALSYANPVYCFTQPVSAASRFMRGMVKTVRRKKLLARTDCDPSATLLWLATHGPASPAGAVASKTTDAGFFHGRHFALAIYDAKRRLVHDPIPHLLEAARHEKITDVHVVCHGWNFTPTEAVKLYRNYRAVVGSAVDQVHARDEYNPYFIFIVWRSVNRTVTSAVRSLMPITPPESLLKLTKYVDASVFHLLSIWGESKNATLLSLGPRDIRRVREYPLAVDGGTLLEDTAYSKATKELPRPQGIGSISEMDGADAPVSLLLEQLMLMRWRSRHHPAPKDVTSGNLEGFRLHTIGHSLGSKVMSLSTLRAADRLLYTLANEPGRDDGFVDSMVLLHPAMRACEMWRPLDVKQGKKPRPRNEILEAIDRIAIVHSERDMADGWVFCTSQTLLSNSAVQSWDSAQREFMRDADDWVQPRTPGWSTPILSFGEWLVAFPFDAYIFASSHAAAIVHTGVETAYALTVGGVKTLAAGKGYRPDYYKYAMGNQGVNALRATWYKFDESTLHADRCGFRGLSTSMAPEFLKSSAVRRGNVYVFNATEIYNTWDPFVGAHNDHRSLEVASKDDRFMHLRKIDRTCRFAHNFTRLAPHPSPRKAPSASP